MDLNISSCMAQVLFFYSLMLTFIFNVKFLAFFLICKSFATFITWIRGKPLTCSPVTSPSWTPQLPFTGEIAECTGYAATKATTKKTNKYPCLANTHYFVPIAIDTGEPCQHISHGSFCLTWTEGYRKWSWNRCRHNTCSRWFQYPCREGSYFIIYYISNSVCRSVPFQTILISVGTRLDARTKGPDTCPCSKTVDTRGLHGCLATRH